MKHLIPTLALLATPALALDVNLANVSELTAAGFSLADAENIVATRTIDGPFANSGSLLAIQGISQGDLNRVRGTLTIDGKPVTTRSGTAPAIPGERPAIPGKKHTGLDDGPVHDANDDHSHNSNGNDDKGGNSGKGGDDKGGSSGKGGDDKGGSSGKGGDDKGGSSGKGGGSKGGSSGKGGGSKGG